MTSTQQIEKIVNSILISSKIKSLPIPINQIVIDRGLKLKPYDMGDDISGALVLEDENHVIGYNTGHQEARQRFTIAHELGHYELHKKHKLFIDKKIPVLYRDHNSSTGEYKLEKEANAFAASILMPKSFLDIEIKKNNIKSFDEESIEMLAETFQVSTQAMTYRITNLYH